MNFSKFFKTYEFDYEGLPAPFLCWIEPQGDRATLHFIVYADNVMINMGMEGISENMHANFDELDEKKAKQVFDFSIGPIIDQLTFAQLTVADEVEKIFDG